MTTIAYRDGVLASDTRSIRGDTIDPDHMDKIFQSKDGRLFAVTGDKAETETLVNWLRNPKRKGERPQLNENSRVIEINKTRMTIYEGRGEFTKRLSKFNSWGSGCQAALGAMEHGASACEAVKTAMKYDYGTGGKVRSLRLK